MSTFNQAIGLQPDFRFESLEYDNACDSSTVKALIGPMMGELSTIGIIAAPYGSLLRFAEGIDSIRNFAAADTVDSTDAYRASAVMCGLTQLGGVIWAAIMLIFLGAVCICAPVGSWCCLRGYRRCFRRDRRIEKREIAIDRLLAQQSLDPEQKGEWPRKPVLPKSATSERRRLLDSGVDVEGVRDV
jgi:hypothetical protein